MSSADLLDDNFPHGTKAGFDAGCRSGGACPGKERGQTCKQASFRYRSDRSYKRLVDGGASVEVQQLPEGADVVGNAAIVPKGADMVGHSAIVRRPVARPRPPKPRPLDVELAQDFPAETAVVDEAAGRIANRQPSTAPEPLRTVPAVVEPVPPQGDAALPARKRLGVPTPLVHGTRAGYQKGCRDESCPSPAGVSCADANREYQRAQRALRKTGGRTSTAPKETRTAAEETPGTENVPNQTQISPDETTALAEVDPSTLHEGDRIVVERELDGVTVRKELVVASEPEQTADGDWSYDAVDPAFPPVDWLDPASNDAAQINVAPDRTPELEQTLAELRATHPPKIGPYRDNPDEENTNVDDHAERLPVPDGSEGKSTDEEPVAGVGGGEGVHGRPALDGAHREDRVSEGDGASVEASPILEVGSGDPASQQERAAGVDGALTSDLPDHLWPGNDGPIGFDPTYGNIDRDIQLQVDAMNPESVGQRVALERTLQDRRTPKGPSVHHVNWGDETTACNLTVATAIAAGDTLESAWDATTCRDCADYRPEPVDAQERTTALAEDTAAKDWPVNNDVFLNNAEQPGSNHLAPTQTETFARAMGAIDPEPTPASPWTLPQPTTPTTKQRRSPHPATPFDREHRHTVMQHLVFPLLRALWIEALESKQDTQ